MTGCNHYLKCGIWVPRAFEDVHAWAACIELLQVSENALMSAIKVCMDFKVVVAMLPSLGQDILVNTSTGVVRSTGKGLDERGAGKREQWRMVGLCR